MLNFYIATVRNLNVLDDESEPHPIVISSTDVDVFRVFSDIPREVWTISKPALCVLTLRDAICAPSVKMPIIEKYLPHAKVVELNAGHWVNFEATEMLNAELEKWVEGLGLRSSA